VFLAAGHQLLWDTAFGGSAPALGGRLAGIDPAAQEGVLRTAAALSSLVTGTVVGIVTGAVAALLDRVVPAAENRPHAERRSGAEGGHGGRPEALDDHVDADRKLPDEDQGAARREPH
jgi:hypothetical protein